MLEACKRQTGDEVCVFVREEWTLNMKPVVTRKRVFTGNFETDGKPSDPLWHRGSYSPWTASEYWRPGASREDLHRETVTLRQHNHTMFIESLATDVRKAKLRFLTG